MAFLYMNPGYVELLGESSENFTNVRNDTYSKTGVAFACNNYNISSHIATFGCGSPSGHANNIYVRVDWFFNGDDIRFLKIHIPVRGIKTDSTYFYTDVIVTRWFETITVDVTGISAVEGTETATTYHKTFKNDTYGFKVEKGQVNSLYVNLADNVVNITLNGCTVPESKCVTFDKITKFTLSQGWWSKSYPVKITFPFPTRDTYPPDSDKILCYSNIIVSSSYISPTEQIAIIPSSRIDTNMENNGDGKYKIDDIDQQLLMTPNLNSLLKTYSKNSKVHVIAPAGCPSEQFGSGELTLTGISQSGATITAHDSISAANIDEAFAIPWQADEGMTLNDLRNEKYGFKTS